MILTRSAAGYDQPPEALHERFDKEALRNTVTFNRFAAKEQIGVSDQPEMCAKNLFNDEIRQPDCLQPWTSCLDCCLDRQDQTTLRPSLEEVMRLARPQRSIDPLVTSF
jgi:hypothetical protein